MRGELAISEEKFATLFEEEKTTSRNDSAKEIFGRSFDELTAHDMHSLVEQVLKGLYMFRKNVPFNFVKMINLCFAHPQTSLIDKNNLRLALELFDFDINELNSGLFIVEQDVILNEGLAKERGSPERPSHELFFGAFTQAKAAELNN